MPLARVEVRKKTPGPGTAQGFKFTHYGHYTMTPGALPNPSINNLISAFLPRADARQGPAEWPG